TYGSDDIDNMTNMNYRTANSRGSAIRMCMMLTDMDIDNDVLLVASRKGNSLENVYGMGDFDAAIRITDGAKTYYMFFDDAFLHFNEIPEQYQGEKVMVMHPKRHNSQHYSFTYSDNVLPITPSDKNRTEESIHVSLVPGNMQRLNIDRTVKETGAQRHDDQKLLVPVQDVDNGYADMVKGKSLKERLSQSSELKKKADAFTAALDKERTEQEKNFTSEIKSTYDQDPQKLNSFKIINTALESTPNPVFTFTESFTFDNMVKKAGNNYIIDAGKLCGVFLKLDDKEKQRNIDVFMNAARSFSYTIVVDIPQGYAAKGTEELNVQKSNKAGSFACSAAANGNKLTITVNRVYVNNFEKAADWPLLVDMISAASDFSSKKILFEKQN
ncbi:MAG: hypothetical protein JSU01_01600, partial [Bacteroidetes bacterium]|nr:hypothetical protein [Bacteroidota bacterium]